jgi:predicted RNA-binding protein with PIN domain
VLVVDAYNVLHAAPKVHPDLAGLDVAALAALLGPSSFAARGCLLVCDGTGGGPARRPADAGFDNPHTTPDHPDMGVVRIVYAGPGKDADSVIERRLDALQTAGRARSTLVISSDRRVQAAAVGVRARWARSEDFLGALLREREARAKRERQRTGGKPGFARTSPLDAGSTAWWLREFGIASTGEVAGRGTPVDRSESSRAPTPPRATAYNTPDPSVHPAPPSAPPGTDPALLEALKEWAGRLDLDDLDMTRWLDRANTPESPPPAAPPSPGARSSSGPNPSPGSGPPTPPDTGPTPDRAKRRPKR